VTHRTHNAPPNICYYFVKTQNNLLTNSQPLDIKVTSETEMDSSVHLESA